MTSTTTPSLPLSAEQLDRIARNYFAEGYAQEHVKNAIHDAFSEAVQQATASRGESSECQYPHETDKCLGRGFEARASHGAQMESDDDSFVEWVKREMPAGTVIGDPTWWAPRILRAALTNRASSAKAEQKGGYCADCNSWGGEHKDNCKRRPERLFTAATPASDTRAAVPDGANWYRKTALVKAEQFLPAEGKIPSGVISDGHGDPRKDPRYSFVLHTKEGVHTLRNGDYICTGPAGEQWNVERSIFESTYELAAPTAAIAEADAKDAEHQIPEWLSYDVKNDVLTIYGIKYAGELLRDFGAAMPIGQAFELVRRDGGTLAVHRLNVAPTANSPTNTSMGYALTSRASRTYEYVRDEVRKSMSATQQAQNSAKGSEE